MARRREATTGGAAVENRLEARGCIILALRAAGCMMLLYILMFLAIIGAGVFFTLFF
ncbi:MAG TPA: hypothetical protein VF188_13825 [Longimicrobiales bacterium]